MNTLTLTLTDPRVVDGWVEAANRNGTTPEAIAGEFLTQQGSSYADLFKIGVITSAAFFARFTPREYATILEASVQEEDEIHTGTIASLLSQLTSQERVNLNDQRVIDGLNFLVQVDLLDESRVPEILHYDHPTPVNNDGASEPDVENNVPLLLDGGDV